MIKIFEYFIKFISQTRQDDDFQKYLNKSGKNATSLSYFSVEEGLEVIDDIIEKGLMDNLLAGSFLSDSSTVPLIRRLIYLSVQENLAN